MVERVACWGRWPARLCGQLAYRLRYTKMMTKLFELAASLALSRVCDLLWCLGTLQYLQNPTGIKIAIRQGKALGTQHGRGDKRYMDDIVVYAVET